MNVELKQAITGATINIWSNESELVQSMINIVLEHSQKPILALTNLYVYKLAN
jgi:hypothetical protein